MDRPTLLHALAERILAVPGRPHPLRVAIDGVDAAGKTSLADELAAVLRELGCPVLRASIDHFHNPRAIRYRLGPDSPKGCYLDTFNLPALRRLLLDPLGRAFAPGETRVVYTRLFDVRADAPRPVESGPVPAHAVLLFDGVFLQRPELADAWDFVIFVQVSFETVLVRAVRRDRDVIGPPEAVRARYLRRYIPAQRYYLAACRPLERAGVVVKNDDPHQPELRPAA